MISLIVAVAKNNVIGNNGIIPWKIKGEQKRFKELTTGKTIIMGRKAFEGGNCMKCSYCNQEMENGLVQSARDIYLCTEHIEYYEKYGLSILAQ